jgi:tripartite-type tricarboxylate transporter receptor subunit TctC
MMHLLIVRRKERPVGHGTPIAVRGSRTGSITGKKFGGNRMRRRTLLTAPLVGLTAVAGLRSSFAQAWPNRPVRIIVPYAAGQGADLFARRFAEIFQQRFSRPFVIENRAGAGGNIGTAAVARAEPDGYTLLWGTIATHASNEFLFRELGFDPVSDFEPIIGVLRLGMALTVAGSSDWRSPADMVRAARARPGDISVGVPSTTARGVLARFREVAQIDLTPVAYTSSGQTLVGQLRGDVQAAIDTVAASLSPIRTGQIRPLAVSLGQRAQSLPDTPTFREAGIDLEIEAWNALYAPRGTPAEIVRALNTAANAALGEPAISTLLAQNGAERMGGTPEDLLAIMRRDRTTWGTLIRSLGVAQQ